MRAQNQAFEDPRAQQSTSPRSSTTCQSGVYGDSWLQTNDAGPYAAFLNKMPDAGSSGVTPGSGGGSPAAQSAEQDSLKKGLWTSDEDEKLLQFVQEFGDRSWNLAQEKVGLRRSGKSCRLRYANHLHPQLNKAPITEEEGRLILSLHEKLGNRWSQIAAYLPGRSDNSIKNWYNCRIVKRRSRRSGTPKDLSQASPSPELVHPDSSLLHCSERSSALEGEELGHVPPEVSIIAYPQHPPAPDPFSIAHPQPSPAFQPFAWPPPDLPFHQGEFPSQTPRASQCARGRSLTADIPPAQTTFAQQSQPLFPSVTFPDFGHSGALAPLEVHQSTALGFPVAQHYSGPRLNQNTDSMSAHARALAAPTFVPPTAFASDSVPPRPARAPFVAAAARGAILGPMSPPPLPGFRRLEPGQEGERFKRRLEGRKFEAWREGSRGVKRKGDRKDLLSADIGSPPASCVRFAPVTILLTPEGVKPLLAIEPNPDPVERLPGGIEDLDLASWPLEPSRPDPSNRVNVEICRRRAPRNAELGEAYRNGNGIWNGNGMWDAKVDEACRNGSDMQDAEVGASYGNEIGMRNAEMKEVCRGGNGTWNVHQGMLKWAEFPFSQENVPREKGPFVQLGRTVAVAEERRNGAETGGMDRARRTKAEQSTTEPRAGEGPEGDGERRREIGNEGASRSVGPGFRRTELSQKLHGTTECGRRAPPGSPLRFSNAELGKRRRRDGGTCPQEAVQIGVGASEDGPEGKLPKTEVLEMGQWSEDVTVSVAVFDVAATARERGIGVGREDAGIQK